ncbi:MAG: 4Fe-4S ferredoxin [Desulfarculus sp.]|nr:4Fe-4S ferredoxin [Desulfarculus sp.]
MDAYQQLAQHLDNLPGGYPPTQSGVELRILRRLFNQDEAELAVKLTLIPEQAKVVARRAGLKTEEAAPRLEEMAKKGLIFRYEDKGTAYYMAAQYVIGIWEYHVNDLDPELIADMNEYIPTLFDMDAWQKAPQLRTIPVGKSLNAEHQVMDYERAEEIVRRQKKLLVAPCICRREHQIKGQGCDKPEESCLVFGMGVDYYEKNGLGRRIGVDEALAILKRADKAGLVLQPSNAQKVINICCCCGCCCHVLKSMKRHPRPG